MPKTKKYVLCISGSRGLDDYSLIDRAIIYAGIDLKDVKEIIAGGAKGVDANAKKFAQFHKIKFTEYPADWKNIKSKDALVKYGAYGSYNAKAGFQRNELQAQKADKLLAIWDSKSKGTVHQIECFKKLEKEYFVYEVDPPNTNCSDSAITKNKEGTSGAEGVDYYIF